MTDQRLYRTGDNRLLPREAYVAYLTRCAAAWRAEETKDKAATELQASSVEAQRNRLVSRS